jgi:glycine dehydrogenase
MIAIRREIAEIENGRWKVEASPLRHAPHTVHDIADDAWTRAYSRAEGCFPAGTSRSDKYWSPVGRVDNVYGDRNLVCSCPPVEDYAQAAESRCCFAGDPQEQLSFRDAPPAQTRNEYS